MKQAGVVGLMAAALTLAGCGGGASMADTVAKCPSSDGVQLDGESVTILVGYVPGGIVDCLTGALGMPTNVRAQVDQSDAADGVQTASWDGYAATWSVNSRGTAELVVSAS